MAGCIWLARIIAKARMIESGELPQEYAVRFCGAGGVDSNFIDFFALTREDIVAAARLPDTELEAWFLARPQSNAAKVAEWNAEAVLIGRPGHRMAERFPVARETTYKHIDSSGMTTVFELIEADEALPG
jgi:hypothetical protein